MGMANRFERILKDFQGTRKKRGGDSMGKLHNADRHRPLNTESSGADERDSMAVAKISACERSHVETISNGDSHPEARCSRLS